jgi:2-polyprenyl-3-methyl-5-hydroxy-6-metoxy-1,4-benzoquinol methylase
MQQLANVKPLDAVTALCPVCKGRKFELYKVGIREHPWWPVYRCIPCNLRFINPPQEDLRSYYADEYRRTHNHIQGKALTPEERFRVSRPLMERRLIDFQRWIPGGLSVFDVGCSSGFFMDALQNSGYRAYGCDYNQEDIAYAKSRGLAAMHGGIETFLHDQGGCISACHILEHLPDPLAWLETARERLHPKGYLYTECPNVNDALLEIPAFQDWYYMESHISYFDAVTLKRLMEAAGFKARVYFRQEYSLANAYHWTLTGQPMPDARTAQAPTVFGDKLKDFLTGADAQYRRELEANGTANLLIAIGRRRD